MTGKSNKQMDIPKSPREHFSLDVNHFDLENFYLSVERDFDKIIKGINFKLIDLEPQTRSTPPLLPFITFFQFLEKLPDRTALDAVQYRMEWKNALHLPTTPIVIRETILCEYRSYLLEEDNRVNEYQRFICRLGALLPEKKYQEFNAAQMLLEACEFNQNISVVIELNNALTYLKLNHPEWFKKHDLHRLYARHQAASSQYDVLIPHEVLQYHIDDVMKDVAFLIKEVALFGSEDIKNLDEIKTLSQIASQIRGINNESQIESDSDDIIDG